MEENTDNALIRNEESQPAAKPAAVYDAQARNRFEFDVQEGGLLYEIAHIYGPVSDDRYLQWTREVDLHGNEDEVSEKSREASCGLWDDIIVELDNVDYDPADPEWKANVPYKEKIDSLTQLFAVAVVEADKKAVGKLSRRSRAESQTIVTECWFNGEAVQQHHEMRSASLELEKKYVRVQAKRFKQEKIGGSLKRKPKVHYLPQDEKIAELYDEMKISATGFANDVIPIRFKTTVIHEIFASTLDPKKSQK